jgi:hypothetical protein
MMRQGPITLVEAQVIAHATEGVSKVEKAILSLAPPQHRSCLRLKREKLKGHHGNPIHLIKFRVSNAELVNAIVHHLASSFPERVKQRLNSNLDTHLDGASLYLRLDKQQAYRGKLELGDDDPIRVKIKLKQSLPIDEARRLLASLRLI